MAEFGDPNGQAEKVTDGDLHVAAQQPEVQPGWRRAVRLVLAGIFFVLGVLGAILPVLPATPFLLLTSYFLVRSSPKLNQALLRSRMFGPILTDWQVHGGVRPAVKKKAIVVVILAVATTIYFSGNSPTVTGIVIALAAIGIGVIVRLPAATVVKPEEGQ